MDWFHSNTWVLYTVVALMIVMITAELCSGR